MSKRQRDSMRKGESGECGSGVERRRKGRSSTVAKALGWCWCESAAFEPEGWKPTAVEEGVGATASSFCVVFHLEMLDATFLDVAIGGTLYSLPVSREGRKVWSVAGKAARDDLKARTLDCLRRNASLVMVVFLILLCGTKDRLES